MRSCVDDANAKNVYKMQIVAKFNLKILLLGY